MEIETKNITCTMLLNRLSDIPSSCGVEIRVRPRPTVLSPVTPIASKTGGFTMTETEKASARGEAVGKTFPK